MQKNLLCGMTKGWNETKGKAPGLEVGGSWLRSSVFNEVCWIINVAVDSPLICELYNLIAIHTWVWLDSFALYSRTNSQPRSRNKRDNTTDLRSILNQIPVTTMNIHISGQGVSIEHFVHCLPPRLVFQSFLLPCQPRPPHLHYINSHTKYTPRFSKPKKSPSKNRRSMQFPPNHVRQSHDINTYHIKWLASYEFGRQQEHYNLDFPHLKNMLQPKMLVFVIESSFFVAADFFLILRRYGWIMFWDNFPSYGNFPNLVLW